MEAGIWGKFQYFQTMHNILDGELAMEHACDPMCSGHTLHWGARVQEIGLCLSISMLSKAQLCNISQDWPPDGSNHGDEGPRDKWTSTWSWISSLIINALQDQEVMPLLIHRVLGLSTRKSAGKCPLSVCHNRSWEVGRCTYYFRKAKSPK